jgi:UrcA family protein
MRTLGYTFAIATACLAATPVLATDARLAWNDLDLNTEAGKAELGRRIDVAARTICAPRTVTGTIITRRVTTRCLDDARSAIAAKVAAKTDRLRFAANAGGATTEAR